MDVDDARQQCGCGVGFKTCFISILIIQLFLRYKSYIVTNAFLQAYVQIEDYAYTVRNILNKSKTCCSNLVHLKRYANDLL